MGLSLVTAPALEPVSLAEAKAHCRIDTSDEDALLAGYILAARHHCETYLRRALMTQTWDFLLDTDWPDCIELPKPPLQSVTSITYYDSAGALQTLATDQYRVSIKRNEGAIEPAYSVTWPTVRDQSDTIVVRFVCGYGSNPGDVPEQIRQAMLLLIGHWYNNRETVNIGNIVNEMPFAADALLFPFRVFY